MALKTVHVESFNSSMLYAKFIQKHKFSANWDPKNINLNRQKARCKNITVDRIFQPKNLGQSSLPILNGSAPLGLVLTIYKPSYSVRTKKYEARSFLYGPS